MRRMEGKGTNVLRRKGQAAGERGRERQRRRGGREREGGRDYLKLGQGSVPSLR